MQKSSSLCSAWSYYSFNWVKLDMWTKELYNVQCAFDNSWIFVDCTSISKHLSNKVSLLRRLLTVIVRCPYSHKVVSNGFEVIHYICPQKMQLSIFCKTFSIVIYLKKVCILKDTSKPRYQGHTKNMMNVQFIFSHLSYCCINI